MAEAAVMLHKKIAILVLAPTLNLTQSLALVLTLMLIQTQSLRIIKKTK